MEHETQRASGKITGNMFLYKEPELLAHEVHGSMGFTPAERPFDFVRNERAIPLTLTEFGDAQRSYPIIFANMEQPLPLAIVGAVDERNLFVDDDGKWDPMSYVPTYLRCYPFAFAKQAEDRVAVVVDTAADTVTENPQYPFFDGDKLSEHSEALMQLCAQYDAERRRTFDFGQKLRELELLTTLQATYKPDAASEPTPLADYIGIDTEKLEALDKDQVYELHKAGYLSAIYLMLYSLGNWRHLVARNELRNQG